LWLLYLTPTEQTKAKYTKRTPHCHQYVRQTRLLQWLESTAVQNLVLLHF